MTCNQISTLVSAARGPLGKFVSLWGLVLVLIASAGSVSALTVDEFNDGVNSWTTSVGGLSNISESGGTYNATKNGLDPQFGRVDFLQFIEGGANPYIHVGMRKALILPATSQFYWTQGGGGFNGTQGFGFNTVSTGNFENYVIDISSKAEWVTQTIRSLRFDPTQGAVGDPNLGNGGVFNVDYIRVSPSATDSQAVGIDHFNNANSSQWTFNAMSTLSESGTLLQATSTTTDPHMTRDIHDFNGSAADVFRVRMSINAGTASELYWANAGGDGYSAAKMLGFTPIADGQFHTYAVDMSGHGSWAAQNIAKLQFHATNVSGSLIRIDFMEVLNEAVYELTSSVANGSTIILNRDTSLSQAIQLSSTGDIGDLSTIDVTGFTITGANADMFELIGLDAPLELVAGELPETLTVSFKDAGIGSYYATLTLLTSEGMLSFNLLGTAVPEPSSLLLVLGCLGMAIRRNRRV